MDVRAIRTAADHAWALAQIERLWDRAKPGTADGDRFEVLSTLIDAYERTHLPVPPPDPVDAILFRMEQLGLSKRDLLPIFKTTARLSEVMNRRRRLSLSMIREVSDRLSIPVDILVKDYPLEREAASQARTKPAKRARASDRASG
jgi:HTH-type transcriptional regulator/antitoxin HigA